jgi:hypothetical protein
MIGGAPRCLADELPALGAPDEEEADDFVLGCLRYQSRLEPARLVASSGPRLIPGKLFRGSGRIA